MSYPSCSLIVSTYNWPEALELVLLSIINQTILPNEVIIADDGSTDKTKQLIENFQNKLAIPLLHVWQEDNGFRLAAIRNKAIATAKYDYIIQIDGDVILNKNFIKDHLKFANKDHYLFGNRVNIKQKKLEKLYKSKNTNLNLFSSNIGKRLRSIRIPFYNFFTSKNYKVSKKLRGCNISFWKENILKINGYNEDFVGWGGEDYEFIHRLHKSGIHGKRIKHAAIMYHIYHKEASKANCYKNAEVQQKSFENHSFVAINGIKKITQ